MSENEIEKAPYEVWSISYRQPMSKLALSVNINPYQVVSDAVRSGVEFGYKRVFKFNVEPTPSEIKKSIQNEVMIALNEIIEWNY